MEITRNNIGQMYDILTVYGSKVVNEVLDMIRCCDIKVIRETWMNIGMNRHVECIDELLKIKI
jgi:hypothetical protein